MKTSPLIKELQKGLVAWYNFRQGSSILYVGEKGDPVADYLVRQSETVYDASGAQIGVELRLTAAPLELTKSSEFIRSHRKQYDYILCVESLEREANPENVLRKWKELLSESGICLLGMNNRLGARFFCGDRDPYTERNFDGVENYCRAYMKPEDGFSGRCYAKSELEQMLHAAGFGSNRFYSVLPNLQNPSMILAYGYTPNEDLASRIVPCYRSPETVFLEEEKLYRSLIENGMFHQMANAYLMEASVDSEAALSNVLQATCSMERGPEDAMLTVLRDDGTVLKKNAYPEGRKRLDDMMEYAADLRSRGLAVLNMELTAEGLVMPYVDAQTGQVYLNSLLRNDREKFLEALDAFIGLVLQSSEAIFGSKDDELGLTLQYGYLDLVPLNSFFVDGQFVFFDQEFREEKYPANAILARTISSLYGGNTEFDKILPRDELYERYGLLTRKKDWLSMEGRFLGELKNDGELWRYHQLVCRNADVINSNRQSINYPEEDYYSLFVDIFSDADTRKLILFGSGKFAERFLELYGEDYPVYAIVDNQQKRWGEKLRGVEITSPELLGSLMSGEYKVIICIKNYTSVMKQLRQMDVKKYSIYDPARSYPRKRNPIPKPKDSAKKYHIGYTSGVFDLFHVGHVNLLKRAKEQCDYLIVGVVSDKGVIKHKGVAPFIPFAERIEMLRSCRYVDEAVEIPVDLNGSKEAWAMYHFDAQFLGSDYINDPYWLDAQKWLREHGSELVFFPYTLSTNSTNIKKRIEEKTEKNERAIPVFP